MSLTTIKSVHAANILVGKLDILGECLCKLGNQAHVRLVESEEAYNLFATGQEDSPMVKALRANLLKLQEERDVFGAILDCFRQVRDGIASSNNVSILSQHDTPEFMAELLSEEIMNDGYTLPEDEKDEA